METVLVNKPIEAKEPPKISKSKYELTLAEFPLFILSKGGAQKRRDIKAIEYDDIIAGKGGIAVDRNWKVYPDGKLGFGTASTLETLFDLFQIWKESGFQGQDIQFGSVYSLLKRRGRQTGKREYQQIVKDLGCLVGMRIEAKNAFWDNELKAYVDMSFHLFDHVYLYKEKPLGQATLPFATIKASDVLYGSIQKNSLLTTDFDAKFFYSLTPLEQRLALYLSKVLKSHNTWKKELLVFARQLPVHAEETKIVRRNIKRACEGLLQKGFTLLQGFKFEKAADGKTDLIIFTRSGVVSLESKRKPKGRLAPRNAPYEIEALLDDIMQVCPDEKSKGFYKKVATLMPRTTIYRALSEVRNTRDTGTIKRSEGAYFTKLIKDYAREDGIDL